MIFDVNFKVTALHNKERNFQGFVLTTVVKYGDEGPDQEEHIFFDENNIDQMNNYMKELVDVLCEGFVESEEVKENV